jgi:hypothetical protein
MSRSAVLLQALRDELQALPRLLTIVSRLEAALEVGARGLFCSFVDFFACCSIYYGGLSSPRAFGWQLHVGRRLTLTLFPLQVERVELAAFVASLAGKLSGPP